MGRCLLCRVTLTEKYHIGRKEGRKVEVSMDMDWVRRTWKKEGMTDCKT